MMDAGVLVSGGVGAAVGALVSAWLTLRRSRLDTDARLERIEHMLAAPDQAWYWTPEWQAGEVEADADLAAGRSTRHDSEEDFLSALDAIPAADESSRAGR